MKYTIHAAIFQATLLTSKFRSKRYLRLPITEAIVNRNSSMKTTLFDSQSARWFTSKRVTAEVSKLANYNIDPLNPLIKPNHLDYRSFTGTSRFAFYSSSKLYRCRTTIDTYQHCLRFISYSSPFFKTLCRLA